LQLPRQFAKLQALQNQFFATAPSHRNLSPRQQNHSSVTVLFPCSFFLLAASNPVSALCWGTPQVRSFPAFMRELTVRRTSFVCGASGGEDSPAQARGENAPRNCPKQIFGEFKI
jgi:hypothetical protein